MADSKRTSVPPVPKPAPRAKKDTITDPITDTSVPTTEENTTVTDAPGFFKKSITLITNNKATIKRKLIVGLGSGVGMVIASAIIETLNTPTTEVLYVEVPVAAADVPSAQPASDEA